MVPKGEEEIKKNNGIICVLQLYVSSSDLYTHRLWDGGAAGAVSLPSMIYVFTESGTTGLRMQSFYLSRDGVTARAVVLRT